MYVIFFQIYVKLKAITPLRENRVWPRETRLNHLAAPDKLSLTVFSINGSTIFRCMFHSALNTTSRLGKVIIAGM